jgi:hypothetical protein
MVFRISVALHDSFMISLVAQPQFLVVPGLRAAVSVELWIVQKSMNSY